jgi:hypothetical protein
MAVPTMVHEIPRAPRQAWLLAAGLAVFLGCLFALTGSQLRFGYEGASIDQAEALVRGTLAPRAEGGVLPYTQGGLLDVIGYLPWSALKLWLEQHGRLIGLRQLAYTFAIPFYTVLLCLLFYGLMLELYGRARTAAAGTLLLALGTMIWPYAKFGMETHQTLWMVASLWALVRWSQRGTAGAAAALGVGLGLLLLTKITGAVLAAALGAAFVWRLVELRAWREPRRLLRDVALVGALGALGLALFLWSNRWRYGGWVWGGRYGFEAELESYPWLEGIWAFLASPNKNVWLYSPVLVIALWYWGAFWRRFPSARVAVLLLVLTAVWQMKNRTWADETWGPRRMHYLVPVLALPLGCWWEARRQLRRWLRGLGQLLIALGVCVNLLGVAVDYTAQAKILAPSLFWSQENWVWVPQLNPLTFNMHLLESAAYRQRTGHSLAWIFRYHYLAVTRPPRVPMPLVVHDMKGQDRLDLWYLQQRAAWPNQPYWFHATSAWLALALLGGLLASGAWLVWLGRPETPPQIRD